MVDRCGVGGSGRDARPVRGDNRPVGEKLAGVVEKDDSVAEQAPTLFGVAGEDTRGFAVGVLEGRAGG